MSMTALRHAFAAIEATAMSAPARLVLLALADCHNQETGRCDPSVKKLCAKTGLSERGVRNGLRELESLKLVQTVFRKKSTGRGRVNMTSRYRIRGGAQRAATMGHKMPPNHKNTPSAFDDLAMSLKAEGWDDA
jgi:Cdc6-like AAA superfamily ATPase